MDIPTATHNAHTNTLFIGFVLRHEVAWQIANIHRFDLLAISSAGNAVFYQIQPHRRISRQGSVR